jgi:thiol-disulfide isomerase/thioredoxin
MRVSRLLLPLAAGWLAAAAPVPLGDAFHRLDRGRAVRAALPKEARTVAVYYGASWCGPCRALVPELAAAYPQLRARGIEVVFVSDDATCAAARDYARTSRMPWLLLPCDHERRRRLRALGGAALPGIVTLDRTGLMTGTSWHPDGSSSPRRVLKALLSAPPPGQS